jgi:hypothetical protein
VKRSPQEQKHFIARVRDKVLEGAKKGKDFHFACLCALVPLCGMSCFDFFTPSERRGVGELTPFPPWREGAGVVGLSLQEIANGQNAQAGELLKRGKIPVAGNQGYPVVEAALRNQGVRNFRPDLAAQHFCPQLSSTLPVSRMDF